MTFILSQTCTPHYPPSWITDQAVVSVTEIADIPVLQKRIAVRIVFSENRNIPIRQLYRPSLVYGGHEGSRAVTLSHDAGQKFKVMGQDGGLVSFLYL